MINKYVRMGGAGGVDLGLSATFVSVLCIVALAALGVHPPVSDSVGVHSKTVVFLCMHGRLWPKLAFSPQSIIQSLASTTTTWIRLRVQFIRHFQTCTTDMYIQNECAHVEQRQVTVVWPMREVTCAAKALKICSRLVWHTPYSSIPSLTI